MNHNEGPSLSSKPTFFPDATRAKQFHERFIEELAKASDAHRRQFIVDENALTYRHGKRWTTTSSPRSDDSKSMKEITAESTFRHRDIIDQHYAIVDQQIRAVADNLNSQIARGIYELIDETDGVSAVHMRLDDNLLEAFHDALERMNFSCDSFGAVSLPTLHLSHDAHRALDEALEHAPTEYLLRVEALKESKSKEAIRSEALRISKFRGWR